MDKAGKKGNRLALGWIVLALVWFTGGFAAAQTPQWPYDIRAYQAMADADSPDTIQPGTQITLENWQQYKKFMPVALQALFSGKYPFRIRSGPEYAMPIGPTKSIKPGSYQYMENTERYGGQAKLINLPGGGYSIQNYVAGIPFPHIDPEDPEAGGKVLFNLYYRYSPAVQTSLFPLYLTDRFHNTTYLESREVQSQLQHVSDLGYPLTNPLAGGYFWSAADVVLAPEQSKYTMSMTLFPEDPNKPQEIYAFVPALRRSLRLSSAARCSPALGTDFANDNNRDGFAGLPNSFTAKLIGVKKVLAMVNGGNYNEGTSPSSPGVNYLSDPPGWGKPSLGNWELRKTYVLELTPTSPTYCYQAWVAFIDGEIWNMTTNDLYDVRKNLWKGQFQRYRPQHLNDGHNTWTYVAGAESALIYDFQNVHDTLAVADTYPVLANRDAGAEYNDTARWSTPAGLAQIMK